MRRDKQSLCVSDFLALWKVADPTPVLKEAKAEYHEIVVDDFTPVFVPLAIALLSLTRVRKAPLLL